MNSSITKYFSLVLLGTLFFTSCSSGSQNQETSQQTVSNQSATPKQGDQVPNNLVCMVNNAYMGVPQLEVPFEGKMYFGCCEMCQERIPKEKTARVAVDPYSLKDVDKAEAYIVLVGERGEVAYFENEKNYKDLLAKSMRN